MYFQKLFFYATVVVAASAPVALAAPVFAHDTTGMSLDMADIPGATMAFSRDESSAAYDAMMNDPDFNPFSALSSLVSKAKNIIATVAPKVAQVASVIKPIVDSVSKVASLTPIAPITNAVDEAVDVASQAREDLD